MKRQLTKKQNFATLEEFAIGAGAGIALLVAQPSCRQFVVFDQNPGQVRNGPLRLRHSGPRGRYVSFCCARIQHVWTAYNLELAHNFISAISQSCRGLDALANFSSRPAVYIPGEAAQCSNLRPSNQRLQDLFRAESWFACRHPGNPHRVLPHSEDWRLQNRRGAG